MKSDKRFNIYFFCVSINVKQDKHISNVHAIRPKLNRRRHTCRVVDDVRFSKDFSGYFYADRERRETDEGGLGKKKAGEKRGLGESGRKIQIQCYGASHRNNAARRTSPETPSIKNITPSWQRGVAIRRALGAATLRVSVAGAAWSSTLFPCAATLLHFG